MKQLNAQKAKASYDILASKDPEALKEVIYPNTYTSVLLKMPQGVAFCPMRYRLRPNGSEQEVPSKYNLYNARIENIMEKKIWSPLMGSKHVAIPVTKFHEWVPTDKGKKIVQFSLKEKNIFWVAGLFDIWKDPKSDEKIISFAIITQEPNDYILEVGHDRCPIILNDNEILPWLHLSGSEKAIQFLSQKRAYDFNHQWEDPIFAIAQQLNLSQNNG